MDNDDDNKIRNLVDAVGEEKTAKTRLIRINPNNPYIVKGYTRKNGTKVKGHMRFPKGGDQ